MSGSLIVGVNPSNQLQNCEVTAAGHLKMDIASSGGGALSANVDVTGNTVGLSTSANQSSMISSLATLAGAVSGSEVQVDVITSALPSGAATEATLSAAEAHLGNIDTATSSIQSNVATSALQTAGNSSLTTIAGAVAGTEMQVDVVTSALPSGAATESTLTTIEADTSSIDGKISTGSAATETTLQQILCYGRDNGGTLDALRTDSSGHLEVTVDDFVKGQDVMADSFPVVIASNQSAIPVSSAGANVSSSSESASPGAGVTVNSTSADMNGFQHVAIFGNSNNTTDLINVQISADNSTFYNAPIYFVSQNYSTGDFAVNINDSAARYIRISQGNTTGSGKSLTIITSKK